MKKFLHTSLAAIVGMAMLQLFFAPVILRAQVSGNDRGMALGLLDMTKDTIKKNYYDPTYHGVDLDFVFDQAKERMKAAPTRDALMLTIASAVLTLDDSHTTFLPPVRAAEVEYGWTAAVIGDDVYIQRVKPGSDAEAKGLKPGDRLLAIDGFRPTRKNLWQMSYRYFVVAPTARVNMTILSPDDEKPRSLMVETKIKKTAGTISVQEWYDRGVIKHGWDDSQKIFEYQQFGNDLLIWKMHTFSVEQDNLDNAITRARNAKTLIIDLRDNGGGSVDILKRMVGFFFDKEIKVFDEKRRKETKSLMAKPQSNIFKGELIVVVGQESASASEVFSRIIQLEKRGKIIGDKTMGAVMESQLHELNGGIGSNLFAGATVTLADLVMSDGQSLEKVGVTPDVTILPTGKDLAEGKDPVLAYAAKLAGVELTPEKAGTFFPFEWPK
ncbi:MAG TPA: S41 family peptidase [Pyrinomonadaceae bacterium]|jgi:carboxyl-terminal processing protease|nr:S41 family peptidase [Pyrinomonadaceae bacterium]